EAKEHYSRALVLVEKVPPQERAATFVTLYGKRGVVNRTLSRFDLAIDDFTRMLESARTAGSLPQEHAARNALAAKLVLAHRIDEMLTRAGEAMRVAESSKSDTLRLETMWVVAQKHQCYGELDEGRRLSDEVIRLARALDNKPVLTEGLLNRACWHFFQTE